MKSPEILRFLTAVLSFSRENFDRILNDLDYGELLTWSEDSHISLLCGDVRDIFRDTRVDSGEVIEILDSVRIHLGGNDISFCVSVVVGVDWYRFYATHRAHRALPDGISTYIDEDIHSSEIAGDSTLDQIEREAKECFEKLNDSIRNNFSPSTMKALHEGVWRRRSKLFKPQ